MSVAPSKIVGVPGGCLEVGSPGDLTILDLEKILTVDPDAFVSKGRNTPFGGVTLQGGAAATVVGGRVVWQR